MTVPTALRIMLTGAAVAALAGLGACATGASADLTFPEDASVQASSEIRATPGADAGRAPLFASDPGNATPDEPVLAELLDICGGALDSIPAATEAMLEHGWNVTINAPGTNPILLTGYYPERGSVMISERTTAHVESTTCMLSFVTQLVEPVALEAWALQMGLGADLIRPEPSQSVGSWSGPTRLGGIGTIRTYMVRDRQEIALDHQRRLPLAGDAVVVALPLEFSDEQHALLTEFFHECSRQLVSDDFAAGEWGRFRLGARTSAGRTTRSCGWRTRPAKPLGIDTSVFEDFPGFQPRKTYSRKIDSGTMDAYWTAVTGDGQLLSVQVSEAAFDDFSLASMNMTLTGEAPAADDEERN